MKIYLDSIGCRLNQSEIELFANQFRTAGHTLVSKAGEADLVVINTCDVTAEAASDSRQKTRQAAHAGAQNIVLTGCWSTLNPSGALTLPGVTRVIANDQKDTLVSQVLNRPVEAFDLEPLAREPLPGLHLRTRAFIKVQDGCDNHCTFCVTRLARGKSRSRSTREILADINAALHGNTQEIVLTGVQIGSWGQDFDSKRHLGDLLRFILNETPVQRLRLSSLEPWDLDEAFFELWEDRRLCRHLHLPLQSGSAQTLRRMARKTSPDTFAALVSMARDVVPEMAITTDVIVGFPGESDEDFTESLDFVEKTRFAGGHVFSYSERPGTPAARYDGKVPPPVRKERSSRMRAAMAQSSAKYRQAFLGQEVQVLWEATSQVTAEGWQVTGLTDNYLRVYSLAPEPLWNKISSVRLTELRDDGLEGIFTGGRDKPG
jgi:threonylcarbamoyladenosine tRNA methylthiotransferase MtaB